MLGRIPNGVFRELFKYVEPFEFSTELKNELNDSDLSEIDFIWLKNGESFHFDKLI